VAQHLNHCATAVTTSNIDLKEIGWGAWNGLIWLRRWTEGGTCEYGNELSGSIKCGEFLD